MTQTAKQLIAEAGQQVELFEHLDARDYVRAVYEYVKKRRDHYSLLQFAIDIGYGKTTKLGPMVNGKRAMTKKASRIFADAVKLKGSRRRFFLKLVEYTYERRPDIREVHLLSMMTYKSQTQGQALDEMTVRYFSEWYIPVIRELASLPGFKPDPDWIKQRVIFPVSRTEVHNALTTLVDLGIVRFNKRTQQYETSRQRVAAPLSADHLALIRFQQRMMDIAKDSLTRIEEDEREVSCITATLSPESFRAVQSMIKQLLDEVEEREARNDGQKRVYHLNVQLFPFSEKDNEGNSK